MCEDWIGTFRRERERLQAQLQDFAGVNMKRFLTLDNRIYEDGALPARVKEMLGFVASLVLRCDDCINYHLANLKELGLTSAEFEEIIAIGMIVGGSITIPHARRAVDAWLRFQPDADGVAKGDV